MKITWNQKLGKPECPYLHRWAIDFGRFGSVRLHHWVRSDDKRAMHDHPQDFWTLVLKGGYFDVFRVDPESMDRWELMKPFRLRKRYAEHIHYVDVMPGGCWTLLYFKPKRRNWGFWGKRKDGTPKWIKSNKYFLENGHHPCDQP